MWALGPGREGCPFCCREPSQPRAAAPQVFFECAGLADQTPLTRLSPPDAEAPCPTAGRARPTAQGQANHEPTARADEQMPESNGPSHCRPSTASSSAPKVRNQMDEDADDAFGKGRFGVEPCAGVNAVSNRPTNPWAPFGCPSPAPVAPDQRSGPILISCWRPIKTAWWARRPLRQKKAAFSRYPQLRAAWDSPSLTVPSRGMRPRVPPTVKPGPIVRIPNLPAPDRRLSRCQSTTVRALLRSLRPSQRFTRLRAAPGRDPARPRIAGPTVEQHEQPILAGYPK